MTVKELKELILNSDLEDDAHVYFVDTSVLLGDIFRVQKGWLELSPFTDKLCLKLCNYKIGEN